MSRQESLIKERYSESGSVSLYFAREMGRLMHGVEVEATVNRYCHLIIARIGGLKIDEIADPQCVSLCQSSTTRAYLVTTDVQLEDVLSSDDWEIGSLGGLDEAWQEFHERERSLCFVCVSVCEVPATPLTAGTAFRIPRENEGRILHTAKTDSIVVHIKAGGTERLPRPDMMPPHVEDAWVVLASLLSASRTGRNIYLESEPSVFSKCFHLSSDDDIVSDLTPTGSARATVLSPVDEAGLRELGSEVNSIHDGLQRRAAEKPEEKTVERVVKTRVGAKEGAVGSLVDAILGEQIYAEEDEVRLRYIRLWQALVDATGEGRLAKVESLSEHEPKELDLTRNKIAHPAGLRGSSEGALDRLRRAAFAWVRGLS